MDAKRRAWKDFASVLVLAAVAILMGSSTAMPLADVLPSSAPHTSDRSEFEWHGLPSMTYPRAHPASVVLANGDILATGGTGSDGPTATTEIFDSKLNAWRPGPSMAIKRTGHTATLLKDGTVLVTGGVTAGGVTASAEMIDASAGLALALPEMSFARSGHAAILLSNGKVLVTGGSDWLTGIWSQAELYDPATREWYPAGTMLRERVFLSMHLLANGSVLAIGGDTVGTSELYDPTTNSWSHEGKMSSERFNFGSTALGDGRIMAAGGLSANNPLASAEIFDPEAGTWEALRDMNVPRASFSLTQLETGAVLAAGSSSALGTTESCELFFPGNSTWAFTKPMNISRGAHGQARLPDGSVLVFGGVSGSTITSSAEVYSKKPIEPTPPGKPCRPIDLVPLVEAATELPGQSGNGLIAKLIAAQAQYNGDNTSVCLNIMNAFYNQVKAFAQSGHLTRAHAAALYNGYACVVEGLGGEPKLPIPEMLATDDLSVVISLEITTFFLEISD